LSLKIQLAQQFVVKSTKTYSVRLISEMSFGKAWKTTPTRTWHSTWERSFVESRIKAGAWGRHKLWTQACGCGRLNYCKGQDQPQKQTWPKPCDRRLLRFHLIFCPVSVAISSLNIFTPKTSFDPSGSGNSVSSHHSKIQTLISLLNPRGCRYRIFEACKRTL